VQSKKIFYDLLISFLNTPYRWGGAEPMGGFDCSGMVCFALQAFGVVPNKYRTTSQGLYNKFIKENINWDKQPIFGSLAFYGDGKTKIKHVGIMLNSDLMIEAAGGDSSTLFIQDAKKVGACVRIRPYEYRKDFLGFVTPRYFKGLED
jgi:cell wall-associated NlpC family hydrolase